MKHDIIFYQFSRNRVERGDFQPFLDRFALDKLPRDRRRLRALMNTFVFGIEGYDADPREIHVIPEVRQFYTQFHRAWPYWLYFCNLQTENLKTILMCVLEEVTAIQVDGQKKVAVQFDPREIITLLWTDLQHMNQICDRAQLSEQSVYQRTKAVFEYFGLPFDV